MRRHQSERRQGVRWLYGPVLKLAAYAPYGPVSRALGWLYCRSWLQATLFAPMLKRMRGALARFDVRAPDSEQAALHLAANLFMPWRVKTLARASAPEFNRCVSIIDARHLTDNLASGRGVVLAGMHLGAARVVPLAVARMGLHVTILAPLGYFNKMGVDTGGRVSVITLPEDDLLWLRPALLACARLRAGGLVGVVADGLQGAAGTDSDFLGTRRPFHAGFAELAVRTGATVVPVAARLSVNGAIAIQFFPALRDAMDMTREQRIARLRTQQLERLEAEWRRAPGSVLWRQLLPHGEGERSRWR